MRLKLRRILRAARKRFAALFAKASVERVGFAAVGTELAQRLAALVAKLRVRVDRLPAERTDDSRARAIGGGSDRGGGDVTAG